MNSQSLSTHRLNQIEQARLNVLSEGAPTSPWLPEWICESWKRCLQQGMQPQYEVGFSPLSQAQINRTLDQNHDFVQAARPELERLGRAIAGTSFFVLLTDANGVVVDVGGDVDRQDKRIDAIARIGIDLSEQSVGTTAICAALNEKKPVWLHRGEHFFKDTSVYSCAGAPLWNGMGECIGMLDLTGVMSQERPELMHRAALSACSISNALLLRQAHHVVLRLNWPGRLSDDDHDGLLLLNNEGQVLGANKLARDMLNLELHQQAHASDVFAIPLGLLFDAANSANTVEIPLWSGLHLHVKAGLQHASQNATQPATTGALQQIQSAMINKAIAHAKGNVAQAAKALGISRATLYRKLARKTSH